MATKVYFFLFTMRHKESKQGMKAYGLQNLLCQESDSNCLYAHYEMSLSYVYR